jgi:hypothetical protein
MFRLRSGAPWLARAPGGPNRSEPGGKATAGVMSTAGQRAMATAMLYPEKSPGKKAATSSATEGVSMSRLSYARTVLRDQALAERRDLKTGQKAMWYAFAHRGRDKAHESGAKGGRGKRGSEPRAFKPPSGRLSEARRILDHSEALALDVLADRVLDAALKTVHGDLWRDAPLAMENYPRR